VKSHAIHVCRECGTTSARWAGRCAGCGEWNTLDEERTSTKPRSATRLSTTSLRDASDDTHTVTSTGVGELDRVLGGGFVAGSTTLLFGEPGVGKSTLALMSLCALARQAKPVLLIAAEESVSQVA
jgi:DNA repair protein RadA/Sms